MTFTIPVENRYSICMHILRPGIIHNYRRLKYVLKQKNIINGNHIISHALGVGINISSSKGFSLLPYMTAPFLVGLSES